MKVMKANDVLRDVSVGRRNLRTGRRAKTASPHSLGRYGTAKFGGRASDGDGGNYAYFGPCGWYIAHHEQYRHLR